MTENEDNLPALYEELERLGAEAARWTEIEASGSTEMVHVGSADPEKMRERMIEVRREAREQSKALSAAAEKVRKEIEAEVERQRREMRARMDAAMAALEPLKQQVKRMEEGIWTVNLYLGTGEEIVTLRTGQPASIETPIHLRTEVLAMDEEVASFPQRRDGVDWQGMDYRDVESFDRWLTEDPDHLAQVLPEERGIVVFQPRRTEKVYHEDPIINEALNEDNFESYWLIRNGENLHRLRTNFSVGRNLMPVSTEFTALFQTERRNHDTGEWEKVEILPGTRDWEEAEKKQDRKRRHYMRVALIVQGLIDRTEIFQPLHAAVNVMHQATYDDGLVVVIDDTTNTLTTSREPYYDWIRRMNADLRPGMRIIGTFRGSEWEETAEEGQWSRGNYRLSPRNAPRPPQDTLLTIEDKRTFRGKRGLVVRYERTDEIWNPYDGYKKPERRASAVILPSDISIIPFDLVTEEEMQDYLSARTERRAYADSFPLLTAAIEAKRAEREAETPFRDLLTRVLVEDSGRDYFTVEEDVDDLVHRFKLGNRWHRPLVSLSQEDEAKALRLIRAEYARIVKSGATDERDAHAVDMLRQHDPAVMFVGRLSSGKYVAFAPVERAYGPAIANPDLWVREHVTGKTARSIQTREWITPGVRSGKMTTLFEDERWTGWDRVSSPTSDLTDTEIDETLDRARTLATEGREGVVLAVEHARKDQTWTAWVAEPGDTDEILRISYHWERTADGIEVGDRWVRSTNIELSYGGNYLTSPDTYAAAHDRLVYLPWHRHRRTRSAFRVVQKGQDEEAHVPADTVVFEAEGDRLADFVDRVRNATATKDRKRLRDRMIYDVLTDIEEQQRAVEVEAIKAKFLAEYPDEEMWEERRHALTKNVRAPIAVTDNHHFHHRVRESEHLTSLHERKGFQSLRHTLIDLSEAGLSWDGLTVRDAYRLADQPWPSVYEQIAHLVLRIERDT